MSETATEIDPGARLAELETKNAAVITQYKRLKDATAEAAKLEASIATREAQLREAMKQAIAAGTKQPSADKDLVSDKMRLESLRAVLPELERDCNQQAVEASDLAHGILFEKHNAEREAWTAEKERLLKSLADVLQALERHVGTQAFRKAPPNTLNERLAFLQANAINGFPDPFESYERVSLQLNKAKPSELPALVAGIVRSLKVTP